MSHPKMHENPLPTTTSKQNAESDALNSSISEETNNNNKMTAEEATNEFFGYLVQLDCGDDGTFEGYITEVQPVMNGSSAWGKVKLEKPLRDGVPFGDDDMAIMVPGELIQDIKVLFMPDALPPKPMPRANALPQKSRFKPISGFQPVKKVTQYTPKTSSTSLNKPKPAQKYANVHPRFDAFPRNSPSNISVSRRSPSVAQSILKMKPPAVYNAQILSKFNNNNKQQQQMRATAKPFIPRTILGRPKRILSITPPIGQEATTSKKAEEVKVSMPKADEEKENSKTEGDEKKSKTDKNEGKKSVNQAKSMEEKKPKRSKKEEKRGVDNMEKGEQRVKGKKKKRSDEQEGEGSGSKVKMGKDERNRLTKEKRGDKNAEEKTKSGKKKAKEEQKEEKPLINKEDEEKLIEEEKPLSEKLEENNPLSDGKEEEQIEEKINEEMEQIDEAIVSEKDEENNKNEEEEVVATEEQLMNEVAEILENVATSIGNLEITSSTGDSSEATAELQTNTSSSSANRTESANEEQQLDDDERENNQSGLMRAEKYTGMLASIDTDAGIYQGIVAEVDPAEFTLKLEKALLNGHPLGAKLIVLESSVMNNIKIFGNGNGSSCYATPNRNVHEWDRNGGGGYGRPYSPSTPNRPYSPSTTNNRPYSPSTTNNRPYSPSTPNRRSYSPSTPNRRPYSPQQHHRPSSPLNSATMTNQVVFMQSMPLPSAAGSRPPMAYHHPQQQAPSAPSIAEGKRRNFDNNRQSPTRTPAAEWSHRQSPRTFIRRAVPPLQPPTPPAQLAHEAYGDYKKFIQPQVPTPPVRPRVNNTSSARRNQQKICGPTGIPAMDCMNGYNEVLDSEESTLGAPLDHAALNTDFDFAGNLALFDKKEFVKKTERAFYGLNTGGNNSRNYRNDENVLMDPSRVTSWTSSSPSSSNWLYGQPNIAAVQNARANNRMQQQQQHPRSKPSTGD